MRTKILIAVAAALLAVSGGYWLEQQRAFPAAKVEDPAAKHEPKYDWRFVEAGEDAQGTPHTTVVMDDRAVGTYEGSCSRVGTLQSGLKLLDGEISAVMCWWAGGGKELGVFKESNGWVMKVGELEEPTAESPGFRGNFQTLYTI